jgi:hypothetical protein
MSMAETGKNGRDSHDQALTGLATLAYLAAGHHPGREGMYQATVTRAVNRLVAQMKDNGDLRAGGDMYDQGIATLARSEAALMSGDERYREAALRAANFIVKAQHGAGGWRYAPGQAGDMSVTGWQVMALHSAEGLGFEMPAKTRSRSVAFLNFVSGKPTSVTAGYNNASAKPAMTAEAMFSRVLIGHDISARMTEDVTAYLHKHFSPRGKLDLYYLYYATLTLFHLRSPGWEAWNEKVSERLVATQIKQGDARGAWPVDNTQWGNRGGIVYTTSMAALTLEVYYRYLPLYKSSDGEGAPKIVNDAAPAPEEPAA